MSEGLVDSAQERLGRAVTVLRAERRMQRKVLAERSGVPYTFLTSIEAGTRGMSQTTVAAITQAFGIMPSDLLRKADSLPVL
jgi:transcriptional regulator with XRE-family HTH domain